MTRILLVEDDIKIQLFLESSIKEVDEKIEVVTTSSASEALRLAKGMLVDMFFVDIQLDDYKGTDLVAELRMIPSYRFTPIIFETAVITEELRAYRDWKCYHYLIKPYTAAEVKKVLADALELVHVVKPDRQTITIEQKQFVFTFPLDEIMYIESFGKNMRIHLFRGREVTQEDISGYSLKKLLHMLPENRFVQCHKSYIIHTPFIDYIDKKENMVMVRNTQVAIPIGDKYRQAVLTREE